MPAHRDERTPVSLAGLTDVSLPDNPDNGAVLTFNSSTAEWSSDASPEVSETYDETGSHQVIAADLSLGASAGSDGTGGDTDFLAAIMGNTFDEGDAHTGKDANYIAGVIGAYGLTGTNPSAYPAAGVLGQISDGVNDVAVDAFCASLDGDSATTIGHAFYGVKCQNSTAASGVHFGLDLQRASHDGFAAVDKDFYLSAPLRLVNDVIELVGAGVPTDGTTGDNIAGPGSRYTDITNANLYIQTSLITTPVWKLVTRAA